MENVNYQSDFQSWLKTGTLTVGDKKEIWLRWVILNDKVTPAAVYEEMIQSGIKWPSEFKLKGKNIVFDKQAGAHPMITVKGKKIFHHFVVGCSVKDSHIAVCKFYTAVTYRIK